MSKNFRLSGSVKKISFLLTVLIVSLALGNFVFAVWNEPTNTPPAGNVAAPINVSPAPQVKTGNLSVTALYDTDDSNYYINPGATGANYSAIFRNNVGIGTTNPVGKLHVASSIIANKHYPENVDYLIVLEGTNSALQIFGEDATGVMSHVILSAAPSAGGNNKHWIMSHIGPTGNNRFSIAFQTSMASGSWTPPNSFNPNDEKLVITTAGNVGIGTVAPQGALDVVSTTGALIVPRMTSKQRDALIPVVNGMIIYNTSTNQFNFRENGAWALK